MLKIHLFTFGPVQENTYILYDEESREAAIVDPGCMRHSEEEKLRDFITERGLTPTLMLCTHQHFDHVWGAAYVLKEWPHITAYANAIDFEKLGKMISFASAVKSFEFSLSLDMPPVTSLTMHLSLGFYSLGIPYSRGQLVARTSGMGAMISLLSQSVPSIFHYPMRRLSSAGTDQRPLLDTSVARILSSNRFASPPSRQPTPEPQLCSCLTTS